MASLRWALCLAALIATTHLATAQITGSNAREATMRAREGGGQSGSSSESSSGGRSSSGQTANTFGTLGTVGGVTSGGASQGGLIGMGGSSNGNQNGGNNIGNLNGNSNGGGNLIGGNGNSNGNSNIGNKNGNGNGNQNGGLITGVSGGSGSGNGNGNLNTGNQNGNSNGNGNVLGGSGNSNGNGNLGSSNGNVNGNGNLGGSNGNKNGNANTGNNNGNGNGNNNEGSGNNGNNNGNGNIGNGNGNNNGNGNSCAKTGKNTCGSGSNDPIMTGFTGRAFNFFGDVGKTYNLISSMNHQLAARLKLSVMSDHNGTTMDGVGFMYKSYRVLFELEGDSPKVYINDKELSPRKKKQKHAWRFEDGSAVEMSWDPYTPGIGNAIVVATDVLKVMVWHTPKGIIDEGGKVLEGYVNFNITLMAPPEDDRMAGIIGETYERFTVGQEAFNPNSTFFLPEDQVWHGKGLAEDYEMVNYWDTKFPMNLFGTQRDALSSRSALELEPVAEVAEEADSRLGQPQPLRLRRLLLAQGSSIATHSVFLRN